MEETLHSETQATGLQVNKTIEDRERSRVQCSWSPHCWEAKKVSPLTKKAFEELIDSTDVAKTIREVRRIYDEEHDADKANELKKSTLPVITFHAEFPEAPRKGDNPTKRRSTLGMIDIDGITTGTPRELWAKLVHNGLLSWEQVALAHVTVKGHGLHIIVERKGREIPEIQADFKKKWGVIIASSGGEVDTSCTDDARGSFVVTRDDIIKRNDDLLWPTEKHYESLMAMDTKKAKDRKQTMDKKREDAPMPPTLWPHKVEGSGSSEQSSEIQNVSASHSLGDAEAVEAVEVQTTYEGVPLKDIAERYLVNKYGRLPVQGQRNTQLLELARELTSITDGEAAAIRAALPDVELSGGEMDQIVANAVKYKREHMNAHIGKDLCKAIDDVRKQAMTPDEGTGVQGVQGYTPVCAWEMPKVLPPVIKELVDRCLDPTLRAAAYLTALPPLGTVFSQLRAKMGEDAVSEGFTQYPFFHVVLAGKAGQGKSWALGNAELILARLREREATENLREDEYREKKRAAKNKKEQPEDPKVVRQLIRGADATRAGYIKLQQRSQGLALYTSTSEISEAIGVTKRGLWGDLSLVWRKGYCNELCGQEHAGEDFVSAEVNVRINCLFAGQPDLIKEFYGSKESIHNGLIQRLILADIGDRRYMAPPSFRKLTAKQQDTIDAAIQRGYNLTFDDEGKVRGEHWLNLDWLSKAVIEWREAKREECSRLGIPDEWLNRSADNGFRAGMIAFELWEESSRRRNDVIDNALWVAEYAFSQLIANFGDKLVATNSQLIANFGDKLVATNRQQTANTPLPSDAKRIVANLPDEFGVEEFVEQMKFFGIDLTYRKRKTMNAVKEQLIVKVSEKPQRWQKTILGKALAPTASLTSTTTRPPLLPAA